MGNILSPPSTNVPIVQDQDDPHRVIKLTPVWRKWFIDLTSIVNMSGGDEGAAPASDLAAHLADPVDAHDATAISVSPTAGISSTNVQAALEELESEIVLTSVLPKIPGPQGEPGEDGFLSPPGTAGSMVELILAETPTVSTPPASRLSIYADTTANPVVRFKDDAGNDRAIAGVRNWSTASQAPAAATLTYITGSDLLMPVNLAQAGSSFRWTFNMTKTGAGTAASTFSIVVGTAGTTADTARCSFTKPAGTADVDEATVTINAIVRNAGGASVMVGQFTMVHNLQITGHAIIPCVCVNTVSAAFTTATAALKWGVVVTTGAADAITIQMVQSEAWNV